MRTISAVLMVLAAFLSSDQCLAQYYVTTGEQDYLYSQLFGAQVFGYAANVPAQSSMVGFPGAGGAGSGSFPMGSVGLVSYGSDQFMNQAFPVWQETGGPIGITTAAPLVGSNMAGVLAGGLPLFGLSGQQASVGLPGWTGVNTSALQGPTSQFSYDLNYLNWGQQQLALADPSSLWRDPTALGAGSVSQVSSGPLYTGPSNTFNAPLLTEATSPFAGAANAPPSTQQATTGQAAVPTPTEAQFQAAAKYYDTTVAEVKAVWSGLSPADKQTYIGMF